MCIQGTRKKWQSVNLIGFEDEAGVPNSNLNDCQTIKNKFHHHYNINIYFIIVILLLK